MRRTAWIGLGLVLIAVGAIAAWGLRTETQVDVSTAEVTVGPISRRVVATGTLQAVTTVEVGAQVSGSVQSLAADYNSIVHAGQIIARLDPALYDAQLREAKAELEQSKARLAVAQAGLSGYETGRKNAQVTLSREEALSANQLIPPSDLDAARIALDEARADTGSGEAVVKEAQAAVGQAQAALDQAQINLEHTIIRSPIDGIVIERAVDVGQTLASSVQSPVLYRIAADLTRMQVQVAVDEADVGGLKPGGAATFDVESYPSETFHGSLSQVRLQPVAQMTTAATTVATTSIASTTSTVATVVSYTAIVDVANPDERLRPGMTANVVLPGARRDSVVRIPNGALAFKPSLDVWHTIAGGGAPQPLKANAPGEERPSEVWTWDGAHLTPMPIQTGLADDGWTELVRGNLHTGDVLVTGAEVERHRRL